MRNFIFVLILFSAISSVAQSFDKGKIVAAVGYDLSVYGTKVHDKRTDTTETDAAATNNFHVSGEYGVMPWLGLGVKIGGAKYITSTDSATGKKPSSGSFDFALLVNAHVVRKEKFDLPMGITIGGSSWNFKNNDVDNGVAKDFGLVFGVHTNPRIYFGGGKFGINFKLGYSMISYSSIDLKSTTYDEPDALKLTGNGVSVGAGFQMKF